MLPVVQPGINFIDAQPRDRLGELALSYIKEEGAIKDLAGVVEGSNDRWGSKTGRESSRLLVEIAAIFVSRCISVFPGSKE